MIWLPLAWCPCASPSSRRAWIEIFTLLRLFIAFFVALLAEGVDRNAQCCESRVVVGEVALLAEGVDRNPKSYPSRLPCLRVALLAEGVDRNCFLVSVPDRLKTSPSSRRAWIEIVCGRYCR